MAKKKSSSPTPRSAAGDVIVVGGGLAGLAAAYRLSTAGLQVTLLEAAAQVGGRLQTATLDGGIYEPAPVCVPQSAPELYGLLAALRHASTVQPESLAQVGVLRSGRVAPTSLSLAGALGWNPLAGARLSRVQSIVRWLGARVDPSAPETETRLDDRSVADFCQVYLGRRARGRLFEPLLQTSFGLEAGTTSRQLLFTFLGADGTPRLSMLRDLHVLVDAITAALPDVRTNSGVAAVLPTGGVRLESGGDISAADVVLAVPGDAAAKLAPWLTTTERDVLESTRYTSALHLAVAAELPKAPASAVTWLPTREGGELAGIVDATPHGEAQRRLLLLIARPSLAQRHGQRPDDELVGTLLESAERAVPGLRSGLRTHRLHRLERATPRFDVGRFRRIAKLRDAARDDARVQLCGDYLVGPHAEAAAASGRRAAEALLSARATRS